MNKTLFPKIASVNIKKNGSKINIKKQRLVIIK